VSVLESLVYGRIQIAIDNLVRRESRQSLGALVELACQVLALLMCPLGGSGEGSELGVDLLQQLG